eukprot:scaffold55883_cov29-Cyclotella_meneghiniana.AAC.2
MQPILSLKLLGLICPCLESNAAARNAAWSLSAVRVRWRRVAATSSSGASRVAGSVKGLFSMFTSASPNDDTAADGEEMMVAGTLVVSDTSNGPSLAIDSEVSIPLRHIQSIDTDDVDGDIYIEIKSNNLGTIQFIILTEDGDEADERTTNEVLDNLQIVLEWERRRNEALLAEGISEEDQYPNNTNATSNVLGEKAKKMQHFAQREIELQKVKREREARKAKYVKDAGGLKYTAIAMANRS